MGGRHVANRCPGRRRLQLFKNILGTFDQFGALSTVATALGNVAAAGFLLWAFQRAFLSQARVGGLDVDRTLAMEYVVVGIALAAMLAIGFFTEPWLQLTEAASHAAAARFAR